MSKVIIEKNGPVKTVWMNRPEKRNALDSELLKEMIGALQAPVAADDRVVVRPSGTEPKVKCYLEVVVPLAPDAPDEAVANARATARARLESLADDVRTALDLPSS